MNVRDRYALWGIGVLVGLLLMAPLYSIGALAKDPTVQDKPQAGAESDRTAPDGPKDKQRAEVKAPARDVWDRLNGASSHPQLGVPARAALSGDLLPPRDAAPLLRLEPTVVPHRLVLRGLAPCRPCGPPRLS